MEFKDYEAELNARREAIDSSKAKALLKDLKEIYAKHGLIINGCGCCGSPFIDVLDTTKELRLETFYGGYSIVQIEKE